MFSHKKRKGESGSGLGRALALPLKSKLNDLPDHWMKGVEWAASSKKWYVTNPHTGKKLFSLTKVHEALEKYEGKDWRMKELKLEEEEKKEKVRV